MNPIIEAMARAHFEFLDRGAWENVPQTDRILATCQMEAAIRAAMECELFHDNIEDAYWRFDARRKGSGPWALAPMTERDAFKAEARALLGAMLEGGE